LKGQGNPLTTVARHLLEEDLVLLLRQEATTLELVCEAREDVSIHTTEAHRVVILHVRTILLVGSLVLEDGLQATVSPADVGSEFVLEGFERFGFIHNRTHSTDLERTSQRERFSSEYPQVPYPSLVASSPWLLFSDGRGSSVS